jgi:16S rRNA (guanine1516-N2)-methyltransferase
MKIAVLNNLNQLEKSIALAKQLNLPLIACASQSYNYWLTFNSDLLELCETNKNSRPIFVDFLGGKILHRKKFGGGKNQLIAKAIGIKPKQLPTIIDATAGLGADSYVLATLGCKVTLIERSPIIGALLQNGLERAKDAKDLASQNMQLVIADAITYLRALPDDAKPDVIYLDPMFPHRTKSALNKKEMRILRDLVGEDIDAEELFAVAMSKAKKRVVVKRPRLAPLISDKAPTLQFKGKSGRFDVYLI